VSGSRPARTVPACARLAAATALCLLAACAVREPRPEGAWLEERAAWFQAHENWQVIGRVGLSDGERGGSLDFLWRARGERHLIHLRTGSGGRQWRLVFDPDGAELVGSDIDALRGPRPDPLVEEAVGWPIPVEELRFWLRGLLPPGPATAWFDDDGTIRSAESGAWTLDFTRFGEVDGVLMPTRMEARSGRYRVRLAMSDWRFGLEDP